jgi:HAD superfamily hydrolase (TIGR01662 family)
MLWSQNMQKIEAVLFDLGNTLIYFDGEWPFVLAEARKAAMQALHAAGLRVDIEPFLNVFRETLENNYARRKDDLIERTTTNLLRDALDNLGYDSLPEQLIDSARRAFYAVTQNHWLPELDAVPTLKTLSQQGYRLGIISNAADDWDVQTLVEKVGVRPYMDFVISSAAFGQRKPAPAIFRAALTHWNVPPARAAMVGDTLDADILGANRVGISSVWITRRVDPSRAVPAAEDFQPDGIIHTLEELLSWLKERLPL